MLDVANATEYEKIAQQVYQAILCIDEVETIEVEHNVLITGRSGVKHQIDVYWRYMKDGIEHQVLVECKYYKSKIDLIHARNLLGLLADIPNSQGVLLTTVGFPSGVVSLCKFYGISLKRLRNPEGSDWDGFIQKITIEGRLYQTNYLNITNVEFDGKDPETLITLAGENSLEVNWLESEIQEGSCPPITASCWLDKNIPFDEAKIDIHISTTLESDNTYIILPSTQRVKILSLEVQYVHSSKTLRLDFDAMDVVRGVLEDFNTKKIEYTLHK